MAICKILKDYSNAEGWKTGDIVDITDAQALIDQGLVELVISEETIIPEVEPVKEEEKTGTPDATWSKQDLQLYAKAIGAKVRGNKPEVLESILKTLKGR